MISKGVRDIFGMREMFRNRAVVTTAQLSKVSPHAPVQSVRASLSGRRADRRKTEQALGPGPRRSAGDPAVGKSLGLAEPPPRLAAAPGPHRARRSRPQSLPSGSHHRLSPDLHATFLSSILCFLKATLNTCI